MSISLKNLSYYNTGGSCDELHCPDSLDDLAEALSSIHQRGLKFFFLGAGSNSLVMDRHFEGAVVSFHNMRRLLQIGESIVAEAGISNTELSRYALSCGLTGLSWMNGLPGQIGATARMNARCYGGEISEVIKEVTTVTAKGEIKTYHITGKNDVFRGYKDTIFMSNGEAIASCRFSLGAGCPAQIEQDMLRFYQDRQSKNQFLWPSCGCVFKNDYSIGVPSGMLLEHAGAKELRHPLIEVNPLHANFVFNKGATADEILRHTLAMRELVYEKLGVYLQYEMEILGSLSKEQQRLVQQSKPNKPNEPELDLLRKQFATQKK